MPARLRIFSYVTQKVSCHGASRAQVGKNPFHIAGRPESVELIMARKGKGGLHNHICLQGQLS
eukprot:1140210-Pelagomonas_calceolata.AAC.3